MASSEKSCCFTFNDKLIYFELVTNINVVNIKCNLYSFKMTGDICSIEEVNLGTSETNVVCGLLSPNHCQVSIIDFKTLKFGETQLEFPLVLIKKDYSNFKKYIEFVLVGLVASNSGLYLSSIGSVLKLQTVPEGGIFLSNGPTISWMSQGEFWMNLINPFKNNFIKWKFPICDAKVGSGILDSFVNFVWDEELRGYLVIALYNDSFARFLEINFSLTNNVINIKTNKKFDVKSSAYNYIKVRTCACFQKFRDKCDNFFVTTSNSQLICLNYKTMSIKSYAIPFGDSYSIQFYDNSLKQQQYCLITSRSRQSCVIDLNHSKVIEHYSSPFDSFIGHFLFLEDLQVLLINAESRDLEKQLLQRSFQITNFKNTFYSSVPSQKERNQGLMTAKTALETRLLTGKCAVSNAESDLIQLTRTLTDIALTLSSLSLGEEPSFKEQRGYVLGFLNGKHQPVKHHFTTEMLNNHCCKTIDISDPWHKTLDDQLIIGVDITNCSNVNLHHFHLIVTSPTHELQHSTKYFEVPVQTSNAEETSSPHPKRLCTREHSAPEQKLEDTCRPNAPKLLMPCKSAFLTTALNTKIFGHRQSIVFNIMVQFQRTNRPTSASCCIGVPPYTLSINDILLDEHIIRLQQVGSKESSRNLAALNSLTVAFDVNIISKYMDLKNISKYLQEKLQFTYNDSLLVFYWEKSHFGFLKNTWLTVNFIQSSSEAHLSIHTRNRDQFFKVIHYFYQQFPEDVLILPVTDTLKPSLSTCLVREADFISQFLGSTENIQSSFGNVKQLRTAEEVRQEYEYQKKLYELPKQRINIDHNKYTSFRQQLFEMEYQSDIMFTSNPS